MFFYWLARRRFRKSFEPVQDGYLFRPYSWSEAHFVNETEKEAFLRAFRKKYLKYHALLWLFFFSAVLSMAMLMTAMDDVGGESTITQVGSWAFVLAFLGGIFAVDHKLQTLPKRELQGRRPALKSRGLMETFVVRSAKMSCPYFGLWLAIVVILAWLFFPGNNANATGLAWSLWTAYFVLCFASMAFHIFAKIRLWRSRN